MSQRDGLQNASRLIDPEHRSQLCQRLRATGISRLEVASFVRYDRVPAIAGASTVVEGLFRAHDPVWCGLVLNERGYRRLVESGLRRARITVAATDEFSMANTDAPAENRVASAELIVARAANDGLTAGVAIAAAFGCPLSGKLCPESVIDLVARLAACDADDIVLADTISVPSLAAVRRLVEGAAKFIRASECITTTRAPPGMRTRMPPSRGRRRLHHQLIARRVGRQPSAAGAIGSIATEDLV
jgi:hydroxymethylglutaryl-CoA lyase